MHTCLPTVCTSATSTLNRVRQVVLNLINSPGAYGLREVRQRHSQAQLRQQHRRSLDGFRSQRLDQDPCLLAKPLCVVELPPEIFIPRQTAGDVPLAVQPSLFAELAHRSLARTLGLATATMSAGAQD